MCETKVWGVLGGITLVLHILRVLGGIWGFGSFSPLLYSIYKTSKKSKIIIIHKSILYHTIYISIQGGGFIGGIRGIGLLLDSPLDRYIYIC
jgi:hypothetical protein